MSGFLQVLLVGVAVTGGSVSANFCLNNGACSASGGLHADTELNDETVLLQTVRGANIPGNGASSLAMKSNEFIGQRALLSVRRRAASVDIDSTNIVFIRIAKTGSTTAAGVSRRIAAHHNLSGVSDTHVWIGEEPGIYAEHGALLSAEYGPNRQQEPVRAKFDLWSRVRSLQLPVFLWTMIRNPGARVMSQFYYKASIRGWDTSFQSKMNYLSIYAGNEQFRYIRSSTKDTVDSVLDLFSLIGVLERYDESLVVLAATLKVPLSEVLYLTSKNTSAGFRDQAKFLHTAHPHFSDEPPEVMHVINTTFRNVSHLDYELYEKANDLLSAKIAEMGLEPSIKTFKKLLKDAQEECGNNFTVGFYGQPDCYLEDQGCQYACLDRYDALARQMCEWCQ